ncbi:MAG: transcription termination/antitermination protein NusG [Endomicrobium sp.]|jgi:transcriptional antiterminator NusG|nr:transcription termination/antitermination protein NusG [Endomicrobium sp.]
MSNRWYIVHTYSGHEDRVKKKLEMTVTNLNMNDVISQILIPTEKILEIRQNQKKIKKRKFYPGYIFIEMAMNNMTYWIIRNTVGVTGFLGGVKPVPVSQNEVVNLLNIIAGHNKSKPKPEVLFEKDENVRIVEGPFKHFIGAVEEINHEKGKLRVMVTIFGRPTPVELDFLQVEKI